LREIEGYSIMVTWVSAMKFKITTLSENHVAPSGKNLIAEHGLSFYIAAGKRRILFDTGQNLAITHNAEVLDIDLSKIDAVVLSHGHYDHTGGLKSLLTCNCSCRLYAHPDVFSPKVKAKDTNYKYIGIPIKKDYIEERVLDLRLSKTSEEIAPGIKTSGEIPLKNDFEQVESGFYTKNGNQIYPDILADDQALILESNQGTVVLLGCSHRGVINTLTHVVSLTGKSQIHCILGGLHLGKASDRKLKKIIDKLREFDIDKIGVGHCTGIRAFIALSNAFKENVFFNYVGNVMEF